MTYGQFFMNGINQIDILTNHLQQYHIDKDFEQRVVIIEEIRRIRQSITFIEEMTKYEKQRVMPHSIVHIPSKMNDLNFSVLDLIP